MTKPNEPEEYKKIENDAAKEAAEMAAFMLKHPRSRWFLRPLYRVLKWVERSAKEDRKDRGW